MESRIYAEDPLRGFLPSTGNLQKYKEPTNSLVISHKVAQIKSVIAAVQHFIVYLYCNLYRSMKNLLTCNACALTVVFLREVKFQCSMIL